jgi:hypothetical protein
LSPGWSHNLGHYFRVSPLNELCLSNPSDVISRYSTSATNDGSTHTAWRILIGLVSLDFGLHNGVELLPDLAGNRSRHELCKSNVMEFTWLRSASFTPSASQALIASIIRLKLQRFLFFGDFNYPMATNQSELPTRHFGLPMAVNNP